MPKDNPEKNRPAFILFAAMVLAALTGSLRAEDPAYRPTPPRGAVLEKIVDVPRATRVPVGLTFDKATITFVESQNDPKTKDVEKAKVRDPGDNTYILLRFFYENPGYVKHRVKIRAILLDEHDAVLAEAGRSGMLDERQTKEDTISFPIKVRTVDWPAAAKLRVIATILK
jgi:hypothetical protein